MSAACAFAQNSHCGSQTPFLSVIVILSVSIFDHFESAGKYCCCFKKHAAYAFSVDSEKLLSNYSQRLLWYLLLLAALVRHCAAPPVLAHPF